MASRPMTLSEDRIAEAHELLGCSRHKGCNHSHKVRLVRLLLEDVPCMPTLLNHSGLGFSCQSALCKPTLEGVFFGHIHDIE